jgi:hypothetical protein
LVWHPFCLPHMQMHHRQLFVPTRVEHPGVDIGAINTIISQAWEALTAEEREQFCKQVRRCAALHWGSVCLLVQVLLQTNPLQAMLIGIDSHLHLNCCAAAAACWQLKVQMPCSHTCWHG